MASGLLFWLLAAPAILLCAACGRQSARWQPPDRLVVGYAIEAPYSFVDETGRVTGEGPEIARVIADRLGVKSVEWRQMEFGALIHGLDEGTIDVIAAGLFITEERAARVNFSVPTLRVGPALLVRDGNPSALHSYEDALQKGCKVAVPSNSFEEDYFSRLSQDAESLLVRIPDVATGVAALRSGRVDGLALSEISLSWMVRSGWTQGCQLALPFNQAAGGIRQNEIGFAFRLSDRLLRDAWNAKLKDFLGSREHRSLLEGFGLAGDLAAKELSSGK